LDEILLIPGFNIQGIFLILLINIFMEETKSMTATEAAIFSQTASLDGCHA